jgi:hypothetical protein
VSTTIISNTVAFGAMSNQAIGRLISLRATLERLQGAIATASAGYAGAPGTEFEASSAMGAPINLFGVQPSETPGEQGSAYSYAMGRLNEEWATFWAAAEPFIEQLDNGSASF